MMEENPEFVTMLDVKSAALKKRKRHNALVVFSCCVKKLFDSNVFFFLPTKYGFHHLMKCKGNNLGNITRVTPQ